MASSTNGTGSGVDEIRYRNYIQQIERDQDASIKDKEERHMERLANMGTSGFDRQRTQ